MADLVVVVRPAVVRIQTASGSGSGFIINAHGTIVTNRHVVGHNPRVVVRLDDGRQINGRVSRVHPSAGLAVVRIMEPHLEAVPLADAHRVPVGTLVVAFGYLSLGRFHRSRIGPEMTVTECILSAKRVRHGFQELQTSAAVNPGNSGGPLVDLAAVGVVGVIFAGIRYRPRTPRHADRRYQLRHIHQRSQNLADIPFTLQSRRHLPLHSPSAESPLLTSSPRSTTTHLRALCRPILSSPKGASAQWPQRPVAQRMGCVGMVTFTLPASEPCASRIASDGPPDSECVIASELASPTLTQRSLWEGRDSSSRTDR